jgi:hypothetical protein
MLKKSAGFDLPAALLDGLFEHPATVAQYFFVALLEAGPWFIGN